MERRAIAIHGTVQGVGFRPFVHQLACSLQLGGFVQNGAGGVRIEVEGEPESLDRFLSELIGRPPPLAKIDDWNLTTKPPIGERVFHIDASDRISGGPVTITPDAATCDACLAELFDPADRRFGYPFINCTHCGPRLTIVTGAPYDRELTTMAKFPMCPKCRAEYDDPVDRRFHAQPNACPICGPKLTLLNAGGEVTACENPLGEFAAAIRAGKIGAMKGLGGYHLVCDPTNASAVAELRKRKHRDEKPLALMVVDLAAAEAICDIEDAARDTLASRARPIVLLPKRVCAASTSEDRASTDETRGPRPSDRLGPGPKDCDPAPRHSSPGIAPQIAPANPCVGVMLPYTPMHHLLLRAMDSVPVVMTSGNQSDEPIAYDEADAVQRLAGIADCFLIHDRPIHVRCDDSVTRIVDGAQAVIRRSRGYAPRPLALPMECPLPILAVGGQMKATFALGKDRRAVLSQHMGDLDNFAAFTAFERDVALYERLFGITPACIAHDLHPDYASTRFAQRRTAADRRLKVLAVQHHHAHMASCMAEHQLVGPVIGVTFDGTGFGTDGAIWGGEFLVGDYRSFRRAAHLRYIGLPGGEQAVREPWRVAAAYLRDAEIECPVFESRIPPASLRTIRAMIDRRFNTPFTSSAGRMFDAVASLIGVRDRVSYEGQAAIELEWLASSVGPSGSYPFDVKDTTDGEKFPAPSPLYPGEKAGVRGGFGSAGRVGERDRPTGDSGMMPHLGESFEMRGDAETPSRSLNSVRSRANSDEQRISPGVPSPQPSPLGTGEREPEILREERADVAEAFGGGASSGVAPEPCVIDTCPMMHAIVADVRAGVALAVIARKFHSSFVEMMCMVCRIIRRQTGISTVVFSGGVFMNALLSTEGNSRLTGEGFLVYRHQHVPCNDGGLSLGQVAVAASQLLQA